MMIPMTAHNAPTTAKEMIHDFVAHETVQTAAALAKQKAIELHARATNGSTSVKTMAFIGGAAMCVTSLMDVSANFLSLSFVNMLLSIYTSVFGVLICVLEAKEFALPATYGKMIEEYAKFLQFVWGRGCLYFFVGSLQLSHFSFIDIVVGGLMCFVGVIYVLVGRSTALKLKELRESVHSEEDIRTLFDEVDVEHKGSLNREQFTYFMDKLGVAYLTHSEITTAYFLIDQDDSGDITCDNFMLWWNSWDFTTIEKAQFAV